MAKTSFFHPPPYTAQMVDKDGFLMPAWQKWFQQLYQRNGGAVAIPNASLSDNSETLASMYVGASNTTVYTSPTGQSTVIDSLSVTNTGSVSHPISIYMVPASGTPSASNLLISSVSIPAGSTTAISTFVSEVLGSDATIICSSPAANVLSVAITGRQVS